MRSPNESLQAVSGVEKYEHGEEVLQAVAARESGHVVSGFIECA